MQQYERHPRHLPRLFLNQYRGLAEKKNRAQEQFAYSLLPIRQ